MGYDNPISRVMCEDNHLIPAHVREALSTPPKGYLNITRNQQRSPDAASMFTTHIPSSRNDAEHYDELADLIRDMRDNPAERGTKTYRVYSEIIDTFCRASELRQAASRKTLADNAAAIEQQRSDAALYEDASRELADEMRANALEHTVLNRLRAEALATEDIYGDSE